jgi:FAD synthetase
MKRVLANGTFDFIHPGHLHYLRESAALGDELYVVIARDSRAQEKKDDLCMDEEDRRAVVDALEMVDDAVLGSEESIFQTVEDIEPDIITLGHDQDFAVEDLEDALDERGHDCEVIRIGKQGNHASSDLKG